MAKLISTTLGIKDYIGNLIKVAEIGSESLEWRRIMDISMLSTKRGIVSIYDGSKYVVLSQYYGLVAYSTNIDRQDVGGNKSVTIDFKVCTWTGYWSLRSIIVRGIKKLETQFVNKSVKIRFFEDGNSHMHLNEEVRIIIGGKQ